MTSFDPEMIRSALDSFNDEEYNEDLRDRLSAAPVFEHAMLLQVELLQTRLKKEHFIEAWNAVQDTINSLDSEALSQGVMGQYVTLQGENILVPKYEIDFASAVALISLRNEEDRQRFLFDNYLSSDVHKGKFQGFSLRFKAAEDEPESFIPVLSYQVSAGSTYGPHLHVSLFATGDVGTTQIHFEKDDRRDGVQQVLRELLEVAGSQAEAINRINISLASSDSIDASCLRHVGYHAEKLIHSLPEAQRKKVEDLLSDLCMLYIGRTDTQVLSTRRFRMSGVGGDDSHGFYEQPEPSIITQKCHDIVFLDRPVIKDGSVTYLNRRMPYLVMLYEKSTVYVPMTAIEEYSKQ